MRREATAIAHPNIALAKYWGKLEDADRLPAVPSLSVTLDGLATRTTVVFVDGQDEDRLTLDGRPATAAELARVSGLLDLVRRRGGVDHRASVTSTNDFPTASGLASSASAFAALALAATHALGLGLGADELSDLARRGSVSAARSVHGGYVELPAGRPGTTELCARQVAPADHLPLSVVVAVTHEGHKAVGSSDGMELTRRTSPYYDAWLGASVEMFREISAALLARDLEKLGAVAELSALRMHACALGASPGLWYWNPATVAVLDRVRSLRRGGVLAYATIDAGPHVKVLTSHAEEAEVRAALLEVPGVLRALVAKGGGPAHLEESPPP